MALPPQGRVRLLSDEDALGHAVDWDPVILSKRGQECRVSKAFEDGTFLAVFSDVGDELDMLELPWAAAGMQLASTLRGLPDAASLSLRPAVGLLPPPIMHVYPVRVGRVRLLSEVDSFRHAFGRFEFDPKANFSIEKLSLGLGRECRVSQVFGDQTFIAVFPDAEQGQVLATLPWETVEEQLCVF